MLHTCSPHEAQLREWRPGFRFASSELRLVADVKRKLSFRPVLDL
jgi:hypothetical protein